MDVILSISFKITAEIEIRKRKLMFCVLLRGGVVSALYHICCFIAMKCVYIVFLLSVFLCCIAVLVQFCSGPYPVRAFTHRHNFFVGIKPYFSSFGPCPSIAIHAQI